MKIFDFTTGHKGKLLGNTALASWEGSSLNPVTGKLGWELSGKTYAEFTCVGRSEKPITPEEFDVAAICFCTGNWQAGEGPAEWMWRFLATDTWINNWNEHADPTLVEAREYEAGAIAEAAYH